MLCSDDSFSKFQANKISAHTKIGSLNASRNIG